MLVKFSSGRRVVENDGDLAPRLLCLHFGKNTSSNFGLIYVGIVIFRAKDLRDELV